MIIADTTHRAKAFDMCLTACYTCTMEIKSWYLTGKIEYCDVTWLQSIGCDVAVEAPETIEINSYGYGPSKRMVVRQGNVVVKTYKSQTETMLTLKYGNRLVFNESIWINE